MKILMVVTILINIIFVHLFIFQIKFYNKSALALKSDQEIIFKNTFYQVKTVNN